MAGQQVQSSNTAPNSHGGKTAVTIDWLTVVQEHDFAPLLGKSLLLFVDPVTGVIESQAVKSLTHEGSYASRLLIRCDGCRVEVSGNPSRWGVPHSLDGFRDVRSGLRLYNDVLRGVGLPEFRECEQAVFPELQGRVGWARGSGCRLTRVDLAQLFETGGLADARAVLRSLSQVTHQGKLANLYGRAGGEEETVAWGGGRYVYVKYYAKGPEMRRHGGVDALEAAKWASDVGLIRHEVTLKSMWLRKQLLDVPGRWSDRVMRDIMTQYAMHERCGSTVSSWSDTYAFLVAKGVPESRARRAQDALFAYLAGHRVAPKAKGGTLPNGTYYRLRADLRMVGVDIAAPLNVSALRVSLRVVEMRPACLPQGFRRTA